MTNPPLTIRPARAEDLDPIWRMWKDIMDQQVYYPYDPSYTRSQIEAVWINLDNPCFVAETGGAVVGAYILRPNQPGYGSHIANAAYMVDTAVRGRGIGRQLCVHSLGAAKAAGYRAMQFNLVVSTNESAVRTWLAQGFEIIGTVPEGFYHVEKGYVDAYIFYRKL